MIQDEVESQLSAMFDGELPAAECELLSRRLDRDETLRARWSRYALIGAAMRSEPVAEYKLWMQRHDYDPEHGKDVPVRGGGDQGPMSAPEGSSQAAPPPPPPPAGAPPPQR